MIPRQDELPEPDEGHAPLWRVIFISSLLVLACMWASDAEGAMIAEPTPRDIVTCARPLTPTRIVRRVHSPQPVAANRPPVATGTVEDAGWSTCRASWYGPGFIGNTMAGGGQLEWGSMVVAHRSMAFGTLIEISYNGRTCVAEVRDRGPFVGGRTFDLGPGTASALGFQGVQTISYRVL